jgi:crossover junction endodeoxyribonuclease RuvC
LTDRSCPCVLGIDPGSSRTGVGLVARDGTRYRLVHQEVIRADGGLAERLVAIRARLAEILAEHRPSAAAMEDVFYGHSVSSVVKLAQARGVALVTLAEAGLQIAGYAPAVVKRAVTGSGRADKPQVTRMVCAILGLAEPPAADAADALAVALCHAMHPESRP